MPCAISRVAPLQVDVHRVVRTRGRATDHFQDFVRDLRGRGRARRTTTVIERVAVICHATGNENAAWTRVLSGRRAVARAAPPLVEGIETRDLVADETRAAPA